MGVAIEVGANTSTGAQVIDLHVTVSALTVFCCDDSLHEDGQRGDGLEPLDILVGGKGGWGERGKTGVERQMKGATVREDGGRKRGRKGERGWKEKWRNIMEHSWKSLVKHFTAIEATLA